MQGGMSVLFNLCTYTSRIALEHFSPVAWSSCCLLFLMHLSSFLVFTSWKRPRRALLALPMTKHYDVSGVHPKHCIEKARILLVVGSQLIYTYI
jgi:hypothetical protein